MVDDAEFSAVRVVGLTCYALFFKMKKGMIVGKLYGIDKNKSKNERHFTKLILDKK